MLSLVEISPFFYACAIGFSQNLISNINIQHQQPYFTKISENQR